LPDFTGFHRITIQELFGYENRRGKIRKILNKSS
jgi:hypothetical protein